ncbi:MAG: XisI protein [Okeania sp. SIO2G4]|uniref:XisI protein n=2 Tax=Okeania TaxID=1458928 RepID=UPI0013BA9481|nr:MULTISPECIES: XisI protein [unclassified Okeania]NEP47238.1 XisI protein [Okeania sp. SIO2H7]NEP76097.1 XisI protein [Okeania sp. SIO2G5]NEP97352.1 XisI protein [Okeania sp. SIO2F5]NEQ94926.1 XisI protein [Okeania sp. SIO2G4]
MDSTINFYRECVKRLLGEYESLQDEGSQIDLIFDDERMRYMALWVGWHQYKRIHQCVLHIDIIDSNLEMGESHCILIQCNDTEEPIVTKLIEMGISEDKISLGFIHPQHREYLGREANVVAAGTV